MADLKDITQSLAFGANLLGGIQQFRGLKKAAKSGKAQGEFKASIVNLNTEKELKQLGSDFKRIRGNQAAAFGASGVSINSKSARIVEDETFENFAREAMDITTHGNMLAQSEIFKGELVAFDNNIRAGVSAAKSLVSLGENVGGLGALFKSKPTSVEDVDPRVLGAPLTDGVA